jgi:pyruvate dehydrogenase E1 component beta subunit
MREMKKGGIEMIREITYAKAILEATDQCMADDPSVYIMGLGVTDPKGVFGTTTGLEAGMRPIMTHQRIDFMLLSLDQIINNAAKWHYMFGGQMKVPIVIRLLIGKGWGQGPQHSQSLQALFAHIPGLKVVMPATAYDAKGLMVAAVEDNNPVIFFEHRWLHNITGNVPEEKYGIAIGKARVMKEGRDVSIVSSSLMTTEAMKAAEILSNNNIDAEVVDLRSIKPLDETAIINSVRKTGRLVVADGAWRSVGFASEVLATVSEKAFKFLQSPPVRITFPDVPTPTSWALANHYYPRAIDIVNTVRAMFGRNKVTEEQIGISSDIPLDVPDKTFTGPF